MIQLKVGHSHILNGAIGPNMPHTDITQLHRQLRRLSRRVRQRPQEEAARNNRSVAGRRIAMNSLKEQGRADRIAAPGDRIVVVVQKQRAAGSEGSSASALANKVRRGDIRHAVVVRVKKELQRPDGTVVRFGDNACVLVNKAGDPIGTRMNGQWSTNSPAYRVCNTNTSTGVVGQELRGKQWSKILSLAPVHV